MNFLNLSTHNDYIKEITKKDKVLLQKRKKLLFNIDNSISNLEENKQNIPHQDKRFIQLHQPERSTLIKLESKSDNTINSYKHINQYPVLFHKYNLGLRNPQQEIYYKTYFEEKDRTFKENLFICHIHLTSLKILDEYLLSILQDVVKERILIVTFEKETYSLEQLKKLNVPNIICLKTLPIGKYIGGRIVMFQYLQDTNKHYENIIFLHDKIGKKNIKKYYNNFLNKNNLRRIRKLFQYVDFIYPNNDFDGDWNLNEGFFLTNKYVNDMNNFLGFENKTSLFISDGIFIANKSVIETIYNSSNLKVLYNILNSRSSFDVNWVKMYYKLKSTNIQEIYRTYQSNNMEGTYYNKEHLLEIKNKDILLNNQKIKDGYILKDGTLEDIFDKLWINAVLNSKLKYLNFHSNLFGNKERVLCINYHCFDRYFFNISSFGYLIETLHLLDYYVDIHITFINSKHTDNEIIKILKERYTKYNTNFYIHHRKNGGSDLKTVFTTIEYCNKNNLNYKWFYHIHTKKIQTVAKDNIVFYNNINCILNMINIFTLNPNFSIFGSGLQATMNALEYTRGIVYNFKDFLDNIDYKEPITLEQVFNSVFFGGNIYISNFKYLRDIINKMKLEKVYEFMGDPNNSYDKYWINILCSNFFVNRKEENIERLFEKKYISCGDCYSPHALALGLQRDYTVMHILERLIPLLLQLKGPVFCYGKKTNYYDEVIYKKRNSDLHNLSNQNLKKHFLLYSFIEGRIAEPNIYTGIYELKLDYPFKNYYKNILPHLKPNTNINKIHKNFNNFEILNYSFDGICNNSSNSLKNILDPYINLKNVSKIYKSILKTSDINLDKIKLIPNDILFKKNLKGSLYHFPSIEFVKIVGKEGFMCIDPYLNTNKRFLSIISKKDINHNKKFFNLNYKSCGDLLYDLLYTYNKEKSVTLLVNEDSLEKCFYLMYNIRFLIIIIENQFKTDFSYKAPKIEDVDRKNNLKFMRNNNNILKNIYYKFLSYLIDYDYYKEKHTDLIMFTNEELFIHLNYYGFLEYRYVTICKDMNNINIPDNIFDNNKKYEDFCLTLLGVQTNINFQLYNHINSINEKIKTAFEDNKNSFNSLPCKNLLKLNHFIFNKENYCYLNMNFTNKSKFQKIKEILTGFNTSQ